MEETVAETVSMEKAQADSLVNETTSDTPTTTKTTTTETKEEDPFSMMSGMEQDDVYKVTLTEENVAEKAGEKGNEKVSVEDEEEVDAVDVDEPFAMMAGMGEKQVYEGQADEEEEAAGDMDDPFAMMSGMGGEQVYKVTLMEETVAETVSMEKAQADSMPNTTPDPASVPLQMSISGSSTERSTRVRRKPLVLALGHLTKKNIGQLKKLDSATFPVHYQETYYQRLLQSLEYTRLGYCADVLVCSISCRLESRPGGGKALYIMTLNVLKAYRRRTLGSQLIQWCNEKAEGESGKADDIREIYLHVQTSNDAAIAFYKSFGFEVTEHINNYYKTIDPPDSYVLRKQLKGAAVKEEGTDASGQ